MRVSRSTGSIVIGLGISTLPVLLGGPGCASYIEGGDTISRDRFTYVSHTYEPKTVTLVDTRTGERIWTREIPVGHQLSMEFYPGGNKQDRDNPDVMRWAEFDAPTPHGALTNSIVVPSRECRRLDLDIRQGPEYSTGERPAKSAAAPDSGAGH